MPRPAPKLRGILRQPDIGIKLDAVSNSAAGQPIDRLAGAFSANVPEGDVDARQRRGLNRATPPERMAVHALPAPLRIARIGANDQLLDRQSTCLNSSH